MITNPVDGDENLPTDVTPNDAIGAEVPYLSKSRPVDPGEYVCVLADGHRL